MESRMVTHRPDPEQLLRQVQAEEDHQRRGRLKIFLGYASGVGKSLRMLDEARRRKQRGEDVVVGGTQPGASPEVEGLLQMLEVIPIRFTGDRPAMDVTAILKRRPEVCIVDGLAYDNPPGSLHSKRWEDVQMLLSAGISVVATVNLQHIDEYRDQVAKITGKLITETIPLEFLRFADEIEVVDAPPEMTQPRKEGSAGQEERRTTVGTFSKQQGLSELREMALLLAADIVDRQLESYLHRHGIEQLWGMQERILVCVKAGTNAIPMLQSGRRNADRFHGEFWAVHVRLAELNPEEDTALEKTMNEARALGAQVEVLDADDWVDAVLDFARLHGITQIFISHSREETWRERLFGNAVDRLIEAAEGIDVRVFP
jgi:two-component system, OmpR family, sensor histidine kinase KdpD